MMVVTIQLPEEKVYVGGGSGVLIPLKPVVVVAFECI